MDDEILYLVNRALTAKIRCFKCSENDCFIMVMNKYVSSMSILKRKNEVTEIKMSSHSRYATDSNQQMTPRQKKSRSASSGR